MAKVVGEPVVVEWKWKEVGKKKIPIPQTVLTIEEHKVATSDGKTVSKNLKCYRRAVGDEQFATPPKYPATKLEDMAEEAGARNANVQG